MQQIYGQWEESSIPTITPAAWIKLTICNLNRLNTPASREKHNQPGRGPEKINSKALCLVSFCLFPVSPLPPISYFLLQVERFISFSLALHFTLFYTHGFVPHQCPSPLLSLQHTDILLGRDFHYLRSGTIYQGMSFSHVLWLTRSLSLYWILFFSPLSGLKLDWWQVWGDIHTVVHVLLLASIVLRLPMPWQNRLVFSDSSKFSFSFNQ